MTGSKQIEKTASYFVRTPEDLDGLVVAWKALSHSARFPMQEYIWTRACAAALVDPHELNVLVVTDRGQPVAIAPLARRGVGRLRSVLLGVEELSEPMDFIYASEAALGTLARTLVRRRLPLNLERLPADSATEAALRAAARGRGAVICRPGNPYPRILLDARWTEPVSRLSSSRRSLLRRMRRRAEGMGVVGWEVLTPAPSDLTPLLDEAFRVEAASWKGREGTALAKAPAMAKFYRLYAASACEEGILRLCFLRIGGRTAAMLYAVEYKDAFWTLKIGYDEEFAACSPGTLLVEEAVRYAARRGLKSFEFLGTVEDWTRVWTEDEVACVSVRSYPFGLRGATTFAMDAARFAIGRANRIAHRKKEAAPVAHRKEKAAER
jgi:CelD/BcsL family acetyltransferase involved in cellulose biosynthesis